MKDNVAAHPVTANQARLERFRPELDRYIADQWQVLEERFDHRHDGLAAARGFEVALRLYVALSGQRRFNVIAALTKAQAQLERQRPWGRKCTCNCTCREAGS